MAITKAYSLKNVALTVGGIPIPAESEDEFVRFERNAEAYTTEVAADGTYTIVESSDEGATCTITLKGNARAARILAGLLQAQKATQRTTGRIPPLPFGFFEPATGTSILTAGFMLDGGMPTMGKTGSGTIEYKIVLPDALKAGRFDLNPAVIV
jgi:hypothetical protein